MATRPQLELIALWGSKEERPLGEGCNLIGYFNEETVPETRSHYILAAIRVPWPGPTLESYSLV